MRNSNKSAFQEIPFCSNFVKFSKNEKTLETNQYYTETFPNKTDFSHFCTGSDQNLAKKAVFQFETLSP